jgi:nitrogen fixation-related uncharacterized protein
MNDAIVMMMVVSGGFALLAVLGALWWFATGQWRTRAEGAAIVLDDDDVPAPRTPPATVR